MNAKSVFIRITRATYLSGVPAAVDEEYEVDLETAKLAVECKKAIIIDAPKHVEPVAPKARKVSKNKDEPKD